MICKTYKKGYYSQDVETMTMKWYPKKGNIYNLVRYTGRSNGWKLVVVCDQGFYFFTAMADCKDSYRSQNYHTIMECQSAADAWAEKH